MQGLERLDELVVNELNQQWLLTLSDLMQAETVSFKRCYAEGLKGNEVKSVQLHCWSYGAVVYTRAEIESRVKCEIVASKP